ncbi:hypothetical protein HDV02_000218 [Globomyces sp. JEL0801]|nr:hypothetical protein HDV02_000218 [Globomyces sp. JEL0801]
MKNKVESWLTVQPIHNGAQLDSDICLLKESDVVILKHLEKELTMVSLDAEKGSESNSEQDDIINDQLDIIQEGLTPNNTGLDFKNLNEKSKSLIIEQYNKVYGTQNATKNKTSNKFFQTCNQYFNAKKFKPSQHILNNTKDNFETLKSLLLQINSKTIKSFYKYDQRCKSWIKTLISIRVSLKCCSTSFVPVFQSLNGMQLLQSCLEIATVPIQYRSFYQFGDQIMIVALQLFHTLVWSNILIHSHTLSKNVEYILYATLIHHFYDVQTISGRCEDKSCVLYPTYSSLSRLIPSITTRIEAFKIMSDLVIYGGADNHGFMTLISFLRKQVVCIPITNAKREFKRNQMTMTDAEQSNLPTLWLDLMMMEFQIVAKECSRRWTGLDVMAYNAFVHLEDLYFKLDSIWRIRPEFDHPVSVGEEYLLLFHYERSIKSRRVIWLELQARGVQETMEMIERATPNKTILQQLTKLRILVSSL